jgi:23S rRNA pseudouridine1911/1915/1917 synthase
MDVMQLLADEEEVELRIEPHEAGRRLDAILARRLGFASRTRISGWIRAGRASIGGRLALRPALRPARDARVRLRVPKAPRDGGLPIDDLLRLPVAARGEGWLVVEKPAGVPSHPVGLAVKRTLLTAAALAYTGEADPGGPWLPHRLDRETSGLCVVALRRAALVRFAEGFRSGAIERRYVARVRGHFGGSLLLDAPLRRISCAPVRFEVGAGGLPARTRVRGPCAGRTWSDVRLEALTGRQHQLRVHLAAAGHPIVGDPAYDPGAVAGERLRLHAAELRIAAEIAGSDGPVVIRSALWPAALEGSPPYGPRDCLARCAPGE